MAPIRSRRPPLVTLLRRWSVVAVVLIVGYLYYHPLRTYLATRHELGAERSEVGQLAEQKRELERRLQAATSLDALAKEARELGLVKPGEQLYIVKGIKAWRARAASIARSGK